LGFLGWGVLGYLVDVFPFTLTFIVTVFVVDDLAFELRQVFGLLV
jgi:hypothetical protein